MRSQNEFIIDSMDDIWKKYESDELNYSTTPLIYTLILVCIAVGITPLLLWLLMIPGVLRWLPLHSILWVDFNRARRLTTVQKVINDAPL
jgi:hypothetical protein